jgi:hypothetical protein
VSGIGGRFAGMMQHVALLLAGFLVQRNMSHASCERSRSYKVLPLSDYEKFKHGEVMEGLE